LKNPIIKKSIAILGSTGSIGTQALEVVRAHGDRFSVAVLTANNNVDLLIHQCREFKPEIAIIGNIDYYAKVKEALVPLGIKVQAGAQAMVDAMEMEGIEIVLTAMVGFSGLAPTLKAVETGKNIALANKETLVVAGDLVTGIARRNGIRIFPVDSEHSAIFQCMMGETNNKIEKLILTASGGPFKGKKRDFLEKVTRAQALKHPNWEMGAKITIDSATLMNKGLEVIEAKWLFGLHPEEIEVVIHPQSIIHSMVQFEDGSIKAQMGLPDMRIPIQFALSYPDRFKSNFPRFNFAEYPAFTFEKPDMDTFRNLSFAYEALRKGGNLPCIMNAANEVAVAEFLQERIGFLEISDLIEKCMVKLPFISSPGFKDYIETDRETRIIAQELIN
jgi:1-deoxy-D-xylulose-5-phosphate reductoisomerase